MNIIEIQKFMRILQKHSPKCFINHNFEMIVEPRNNIYFRLVDVDTELVLKCKVIAWLSRPSCKGVSDYWQKRIRAAFNEYLGTDFTFEEMEQIYTYLGNDCNRNLTIQFIESNYDMTLLGRKDAHEDSMV